MKLYKRLCIMALVSLFMFTLGIFSNNIPLALAQSGTSSAKITYRHFSGNGTFIIGKDIRAGTYRTRGASSGCYFARLRGFGDTISDIITNEITDASAIVMISASDRGFQTSNCGTWTQDLSAITKNKTTFADGTYIVGTDIRPGTYRTRKSSRNCYFARLNGFSDKIDEAIINEITDASAIVMISASDRGFQTSNCGTWTQNLSAITKSKTTFGDGTYIVGTDIKPGTYRMSKSSHDCYYERLSGFSGTIDDIIAIENTDGRAIITISPSDKGFRSERCGTWTRV